MQRGAEGEGADEGARDGVDVEVAADVAARCAGDEDLGELGDRGTDGPWAAVGEPPRFAECHPDRPRPIAVKECPPPPRRLGERR